MVFKNMTIDYQIVKKTKKSKIVHFSCFWVVFLTSWVKKIIKKSPVNQGYKNKKWTGLLIQDYVKKEWGINISLRTAQLWLSKIR